MTKAEITVCSDALDYIGNVTEKQGRVLDFETMYEGYVASFGKYAGLTKIGFKTVFESYIEALIEQDMIENMEKERGEK